MGKKYKKNKKYKKAGVGTSLLVAQAIPTVASLASTASNIARARQAEKNVNQDDLEFEMSPSLRKFLEEPFSRALLERSDEISSRDFATSLGQTGPRDRARIVGQLKLAKDNMDLKNLGLSDAARQKSLLAAADFDLAKGTFDANMTRDLLKNIGESRGATQQSLVNIAGDIGETIDALAGIDDLDKFLKGEAEEGGKIDKDGGVTPGEFNHSSNPIDLVKDGKKIGEATGGELILPPDDVEEIRTALEKENKDEAFNLMKQLVDKYDKNSMGESKEAQNGSSLSGAESKDSLSGAIPKDKAKQIMDMMNDKFNEVTNTIELPFDEDVENPAGLFNFMNAYLPFKIKSEDKEIINFVKKYRDYMIREKEKRNPRN